MVVLKPRLRLISCRLTEDEYRALYHLCITAGASSVSGFVRDTLRARIRSGQAPNAHLGGDLEAHSRAIEGILAEVADLKKRLETAPRRPEPDDAEDHTSKS